MKSFNITTFKAMMWIFLPTLIFAVKIVGANRDDIYVIPTPDIVAFINGGFRVSIPGNSEISGFSFHGSVNKEIEPVRPGMINMETRQPINGKWSLENKHTQLQTGDVMSYWVFVKKSNLGYVRQPQTFEVTQLVPYFEDIAPGRPEGNVPPTGIPGTSELPWSFPTEASDTTSSSLPCHDNNLSLIALQNRVNSLSESVELLMEIVEKIPEAKKLTLSGRIPRGEEPAATVRFVLWDKLDLQAHVNSAVRNSEGSITFLVETLQEKIEILKLAREKLVNSQIVIS